MSVILKHIGIFFSAIIIIALVVVITRHSNVGAKEVGKAQRQNQKEDNGEQYKMYFSFNKGQSQIIDLIKGKTEFNMVYTGDSKVTAKLLYPDGTLLSMLADVSGPYNRVQIIEIPETGAYLLDVKTSGEWSLSRK